MHVSSYMSRVRVYLYLTIVVSETVGGLIDESYLWIDTRLDSFFGIRNIALG